MAELINWVKVSYHLDGISDVMTDEVHETVEKKLEVKMTSAIKKLQANYGEDVDLKLDVKLQKKDNGKYDGSLVFCYNDECIPYSPDVPFKILTDIVSHAFDLFKRTILEK